MEQTKLGRTVMLLLLLFGLTAIFYFGKIFLIPIFFGGLFAILFEPLKQRLMRWGVHQILAISICVLALLLVAALFFFLLGYQGNSLINDWPEISAQLQRQQDQLELYIIDNLGIASAEQIESIKTSISEQSETIRSWVVDFMGSLSTGFTQSLLVIVYMFLFMLESKRLKAFILKLTPEKHKNIAHQALRESSEVVNQYLIGRLILIGILSVIYSIGFLIFGLQYAVAVAILAASLSIIPYIGNIIGGLIAVLIALATGGGITLLLGVLGTMTVAQILENNVLSPWIVGRQVSLNPLTTFTVIIGFSLLWGIAGTIIAIPLFGMVKEVFDKIPALQPIGFMMGLDKAEE